VVVALDIDAVSLQRGRERLPRRLKFVKLWVNIRRQIGEPRDPALFAILKIKSGFGLAGPVAVRASCADEDRVRATVLVSFMVSSSRLILLRIRAFMKWSENV
jgi:hypothetical protein